jgi:hypothetical protein
MDWLLHDALFSGASTISLPVAISTAESPGGHGGRAAVAAARVNYCDMPFPRPSGVLRTSGFPRASGFPGRRAVCRSGCAGADGEGLRLRRKLAAEKDLGRSGVVFPNANPFRQGDVSLGREGCACIKSVNMELN